MIVLFTRSFGGQFLESGKLQHLKLLFGHNGVIEGLTLVRIEAVIFKLEDVRILGKEILDFHVF
jgi:hypothetical protein